MAIAKAWAAATGGHRAGVLESSFVADVKSDPDGRADHSVRHAAGRFLLCFDKLVEEEVPTRHTQKN